MEKYLSEVPEKIKKLILDLAATQGMNLNDYSNNELIGFIQGAVAMYKNQQKIIAALEVEIDLLQGESL